MFSYHRPAARSLFLTRICLIILASAAIALAVLAAVSASQTRTLKNAVAQPGRATGTAAYVRSVNVPSVPMLVTITPAISPTAADNDYTRINNAIQSSAPGDTITLNGTFDWTEANAAASWALGSDGIASTGDDYSILVPANLNNVTLTANNLGDATIQGPGDLPAVNLEGVLVFDGGDNQNWTISNLRFLDFDLSIGMFAGAGGADAFNNTHITNNYIRIAKDLNATVAPADVNQNIGIHFSFGTNELISGNTIEIQGDGVSDSGAGKFATDVGMQSNTSGGNVYDGLQITNNIIRVLNAQSADPQIVLGIWENAHGHSCNITISGNQFINLAGGNNPAANLQRGFRVTSHSSATTAVTYQNNTVMGANIGFQWLADANFSGNQPVKLTSNTVANNATGVLVQSQGLATLSFNRIVGNSIAGLNNVDGMVTAENDWWGCNAGPGNAGCNSVSGSVDFNPWIVLNASATPNSIVPGGTSNIAADMTHNSDANVPVGTLPDIPDSYSATNGTMNPTSGAVVAGAASSMFTSTNGNSAVATVTVDNQSINLPISVTAPTFSIDDVTHVEGTTPGTTTYTFTVTKTGSTALSSSVNFNTQDGSATLADNDYQSNSGTLTFAPADSTMPITVLVTRDPFVEPDEAFTVHLSAAVNATISDADGTGTIQNDDSAPAVVYVDDDFTGPRGSDPDGAGPATAIGYDAFATIQAGIDAVTPGGTVNVAAGAYAENVLVNKTVSLLGPNAAVNPNTGSRAAEAIVMPATTQTSVQGSTSGTIFRVGNGSGHVDGTIKGFTIDGHNASLTGGRVLNGVEVDTGAGIVNSTGSFDSNPGAYDATVIVQNNIIKNLERYGVLADNIPSRPPAAGTDVSFNKIDNLPSGNNFGGGRGRGIAFEENLYGSATFNVITRVNVGWQDDNYNLASPGAATLVDHNTIHTYHRGIFHNLQYQDASNATISNNQIFVETTGDFAATATNFGLELASIQSAVGVTVTGNNSTGNVYGILLWNLPTTATITVSGGTLSGNSYGVYATSNDPQFGGASPSSSTVSGVTVSNATIAAIASSDVPATAATSLTVSGATSVTGGPIGLLVEGPGANVSMIGATITGVGTGISLQNTAGGSLTANAHFNRIISSTTAIANPNNQTANLENNWWGCNAGPGNTGCGAVTGTGADFDPWIVLLGSASPSSINPGGSSNVAADMTHNSANAVPAGTLPDMPISYSATNGTMNPTSGTVVAGAASSQFTSTNSNSAVATLTVDNQNTAVPITVNAPSFTIDDVTHSEGNAGTTSYTFTITKTGTTAFDASVDYATVNGTATAPSDFTAIPTTTITFSPTDTTKQFTVLVNGDATVEPDETFTVHLSNVVGATIADADGTGTILNDDTDVSVAVSPTSVAEDGATNMIYTFTRAGVISGSLTVNFSVAGTATFGTDYAQTDAASFTSSSGTVTFGAGNSTATVTIDPTADSTYEADETVILAVTSGAGYNAGSPTSATGTITNDDPIPTSLVVTKTADTNDGFCTVDDCSLREAISNANTNADLNTITFNIPAATDPGCNSGSGVCTIAPLTNLPLITQPVVIDGYSQPLATANTLAVGDDAALKIQLDGANIGVNARGLDVRGGGATIKGLVMNHFGQAGIWLQDTGSNIISGNFIGTDVAGAAAAGNLGAGILIAAGGSNNIGGTTAAARNLISGNGSDGIDLSGVTVTTNSIKGNYIGTDRNGMAALGNFAGVSIQTGSGNTIGGSVPIEANLISGNTGPAVSISLSSGNVVIGNLIGTKADGAASLPNEKGIVISDSTNSTIGDVTPGAANTIANNNQAGVTVSGSSTGNSIRGNSIRDNGALGINLAGGTEAASGVTENDPQDPDTGANNLQNFPVIRNALLGGPNTIRGTLNSTPSQTFTIDLYANSSCDASGNGEGKTYLGSTNTATGANGDGLWSFGAGALSPGDVITATATDSSGNTSEFSACFTARTFTAGTIAFAQANTDDPETNSGSHPVNIVVTRTGGGDGAVSVHYDVTDNTATTGDNDYSVSTASGTFNWANGDSSNRTITITVNGDTKFEPDETVNLALTNATGGAALGTSSATLTIKNDDNQPTISIDDVTHNEGNAGTTDYDFTVSLSNSSYQTITVNAATADDTAMTGDADYSAVPSTLLTFAPDTTTQHFHVLVNGDNKHESNERFLVNLSTPNANATISDNQGIGTITNDDPVPALSINDVTHAEGNTHGINNDPDATDYSFTVSLSNPSDQIITVDYATVNDTATAPSDFNAITTTTLTFNPGETSKPVTVTVNGDTTYELSEQFFVDLSNVNANATILDGHGIGTITNDDAAPTLAIGDRTLNEGTNLGTSTSFNFIVTKTGSTGVNATVNFATADGTATGNPVPCPSGDDYQTQTGSLTFLPNETTKTITVPVCKDPTFEANETFFVNLSGEVNATLTDSQGLGTILNDDIPSSGFVVNTTDDNDDGICNAAHCSLREAINAANGSSTAVAISFAIPADDHINLAGPRHFYYANDNVPGQVTLANVTATTAADDTTIVGIDPDWPHGWWSILPTSQLPATTKQVFVDGYSQTGAALNNLPAGDNAILRIELDGASAGPNVTGLSIAGGTSTVRGLVVNRFQRDGGAVTPAGIGLDLQSGGTTVTGNFIGSDVSGTLDLGNGGSGISTSNFNATIGGSTADVVNLISGNDGNGITFSNSNTNTILGNLIGTKANGSSALGNGASGIGFSGLGSVANNVGGPGAGEGNTIAFNGADGVRLDTASFGNSIRGNSIFSNGSAANDLAVDLGADGVTANDAKDPDTGPNNLQNFPLITSALVTGNTRTITGTLNSTVGDTFTIDFYQNPACDTSGNGEGKTYLGSITTSATNSNGDVSFTFHPAMLTIGQLVTATATSTSPAFNTSEFSACFPITDGAPGAGDIQFTSATYSVGEGGGTAAITVTRVGGTNGSVTANLSTSDGTAQAPGDYTAVNAFPITYVEGETGTKTVNITIVNDATFEGPETINLSLGSTQINAPRRDDSSVRPEVDPHAAVLTIVDNDPAPTFTIDDVTHNEGNSGTTAYTFTVTKTGSTAVNANVDYATVNGTASAPSDFTAIAATTLTFLPADTTKQFTVLVNGDTTVESDEAFTVHLSNAVNATISDADGAGSIINDDTNVSVAVSPASVSEDGATNLVYTFTRSGVTSGALTVNFSVTGTATFGTDYTQSGAATFGAGSGTVTFGAGNSTAAVTIDPTVDTTVEADETVVLTVTSGTNYNVSSPSVASGAITNDDTDVSVAVSPASVAEDGTTNLVYTFTRTGVTGGALTVNFSVGGTATPGTDYTQTGAAAFGSTSGTVTFGAGNATAAVTIDPTPDLSFEPDETVILTVTSGTGYNVSSPSSATGTITNDDPSGGVVRFSSTTYNTTESSFSTTITVERIGDTTQPVTVNYATPDDSAATVTTPCSTVTGLASPRCDFTTALGTLRFAAGETSKTFNVLISQDHYVEGPESLTLTLSNPTGGAVLGVPATATLTIADDATEPAANPIDDAGNFVRQQYHDFLNREPDASGLAFWTNEITSCGSDAQCIQNKRINVSSAFYLSIEFQNTGYLVERLYKTSYGDATGTSTIGGTHQLAVPIVRFSEFLPDTQRIGQGVIVGQTGWELAIENNKQAFVAEFVQRSRFTTAYANTLTPAQFVDLLFANAGVAPTQAERQAAIDEFGSASTSADVAARGRALRRVAEHDTLIQQEFNRAFVLMQYFGYLRRNPNSAPDSDYSGYDFWLTKLNQFTQPGDDVLVRVQKAEMVKAFINSSEYRNRFGTP